MRHDLTSNQFRVLNAILTYKLEFGVNPNYVEIGQMLECTKQNVGHHMTTLINKGYIVPSKGQRKYSVTEKIESLVNSQGVLPNALL